MGGAASTQVSSSCDSQSYALLDESDRKMLLASLSAAMKVLEKGPVSSDMITAFLNESTAIIGSTRPTQSGQRTLKRTAHRIRERVLIRLHIVSKQQSLDVHAVLRARLSECSGENCSLVSAEEVSKIFSNLGCALTTDDIITMATESQPDIDLSTPTASLDWRALMTYICDGSSRGEVQRSRGTTSQKSSEDLRVQEKSLEDQAAGAPECENAVRPGEDYLKIACNAARRDDVATLQELSRQIDLRQHHQVSGRSPLYFACLCGSVESVIFLIDTCYGGLEKVPEEERLACETNALNVSIRCIMRGESFVINEEASVISAASHGMAQLFAGGGDSISM